MSKAGAGVSPVEIQKSLKDIDFPCKKQDLIQHAKNHGADEDVLNILQQLPEQEYHNAIDVSKAVGQVE
jgi:hypothetical protein